MTGTESDWHAQRSALLRAVGEHENVVCYVPGWGPVGIDKALQWLKEQSRGASHTDFRVSRDQQGTVVWFKHWLRGEVEPDWPEEWPDPDDG